MYFSCRSSAYDDFQQRLQSTTCLDCPSSENLKKSDPRSFSSVRIIMSLHVLLRPCLLMWLYWRGFATSRSR